MKPTAYDHNAIEKKWQKTWESAETYKTETGTKKKKHYVLDMFPYPSGVGLHVGHPRGYIGSDVYARQKRMEGFNVLHPMGFDSFGLPAEQYAIATGKNPAVFTEKLVAQYKTQLSIMGLSYDWSREVSTHRPEYYKWTQWIFLQLFDAWYDTKKNTARPISDLVTLFSKSGNKNISAVVDQQTPIFSAIEWAAFSKKERQEMLMKYRLAYEGYAEVNWCQELGTVLANDEIVDGPKGPVSERGGFPVIKKSMRQWFMRITAYADRLAADLNTLDWPNNIKEIQKNWIGKSEGSEITFELFSKNDGHSVGDMKVFTTRADTLFGVTYVVFAPEHADVEGLREYITNWKSVEAYIKKITQKDVQERTAEGKEKTGIVLEGLYAINPANGEAVPVWIADYVLASYGTGAVMAVPAHDERDFEFARKYHVSIKRVINDDMNKGNVPREYRNDLNNYIENIATAKDFCFTGYGILVNSGEFNGLTSEEAKKKITEYVGGRIVTKYKMRDAIFARQRYWGEPIPLRSAPDSTVEPLKEKELPLILPKVKSYEPTGTGESPLASIKSWTKEGYETNTMPGWAGSSWYFLRYMDPQNTKVFAGKKMLDYWKEVDMYVGGAEHATGHLLYSRFWHKFLYDMKYVPVKEPFKALRNQGMIGGADGRKMSKRWGNVINPDDVVKTYGADSLRVFEMFLGPFDAHLPWSTDGIMGARRFIERVWRLGNKLSQNNAKKTDASAEKVLHKTIKKVSDDIASFSFNTAVSSMMICLNEMEKAETISIKDFKLFLQILAPFAPHVTDELWKESGEKKSIHGSVWPKANQKLLIDDTVTLGVQINGKVRDELTVAATATKEEIEAFALALPKIQGHLSGKQVKKVIVVPGRAINIVASE
ncbi:MAG: leucine--tRNA ligase [Minisyncoccia bacterium]